MLSEEHYKSCTLNAKWVGFIPPSGGNELPGECGKRNSVTGLTSSNYEHHTDHCATRTQNIESTGIKQNKQKQAKLILNIFKEIKINLFNMRLEVNLKIYFLNNKWKTAREKILLTWFKKDDRDNDLISAKFKTSDARCQRIKVPVFYYTSILPNFVWEPINKTLIQSIEKVILFPNRRMSERCD